MKTIIFIIGLALLATSSILYAKYIWKWDYFNSIYIGNANSNSESNIKLSLLENNLQIEIISWGSWREIDSIITNVNNKNIVIQSYAKPISLIWNPDWWKTTLPLKEKGIYKIYYQQKDGKLLFIKDIEYK